MRRHFNTDVDMRRATRLCRVDDEGTTAETFVTAFEKLGYDARWSDRLRWEDLLFLVQHGRVVVVEFWSDLDEGGKPGLPDGHWSVVESVTAGEIRIWDPSAGTCRTLPRQFFEARWYSWDYVNKNRHRRIDRVCAAVIVNREPAQADAPAEAKGLEHETAPSGTFGETTRKPRKRARARKKSMSAVKRHAEKEEQ